MRSTKLWTVAILSLVASASVAIAHEFWIQPVSFRPALNAEVGVRLMVGDGFPGEARTRDSKKIERLDVLGPSSEGKAVAIDGKDGDEPVGVIKLARPGVHAIVYRGRETTIELEAQKFEDYLREEGLDAIIKRRAELGESKAAGREGYSRCAKSLVTAGGEASGAWDASGGLKVEIVPTANPCAARAGDTLGFRLIRDGKPVQNAQLTALTQAAGSTVRMTSRTDDHGEASFTLRSPGLWVINVVLMDRVDPAANRADVDWISIWSSLSFELAPSESPPRTDKPAAGTP